MTLNSLFSQWESTGDSLLDFDWFAEKKPGQLHFSLPPCASGRLLTTKERFGSKQKLITLT